MTLVWAASGCCSGASDRHLHPYMRTNLAQEPDSGCLSRGQEPAGQSWGCMWTSARARSDLWPPCHRAALCSHWSCTGCALSGMPQCFLLLFFFDLCWVRNHRSTEFSVLLFVKHHGLAVHKWALSTLRIELFRMERFLSSLSLVTACRNKKRHWCIMIKLNS